MPSHLLQVFFSRTQNPFIRPGLPFTFRLWYNYASWCYFINFLLVPIFVAVPLISVAAGVHPVLLDWNFALYATLQYGSIILVQLYAHSWDQSTSSWFSSVRDPAAGCE